MPSLEQQGRIVPANNRYRAGEASIRSSEEQDRSRHSPLGPPGRAGVEHWDRAVQCVSVDPVLSGCVV